MSQPPQHHAGRHQHGAGVAKGGFWLAIGAAALALAAAPGRSAGLWSGRVEDFLLRWAGYQGLFAGCFGVGVILADLRKSVARWALPAVVMGFLAALFSGAFAGLGR